MTFDHKQFRFDMIEKRIMQLDTTMQIASEQIGIQKLLYSKIERGKEPDLHTFGLICGWIGKGVNRYFVK
jgi:hypothetical protein